MVSKEKSMKIIDEKITDILQNWEYLSEFIIDDKNPRGKGSFGVVFESKYKNI